MPHHRWSRLLQLDEIPTPAFLIDRERLEANAAMARARAKSLGVALRPHAKTHKCLEIAHIQVDDADPRLTVSTLAEARFFMDGGFEDICLAFPLARNGIHAALDLSRENPKFSVMVDHESTLRLLGERAAARSQNVRVWLKVDCGYHRAGVDPAGPDAPNLARRLRESPWTTFCGLLAHGGHAYHARSRAGIVPFAREERDQTRLLAKRLEEAGIRAPSLSIGSTPTLVGADHLDGIDEIRPGNYIFFDRSQVAIGSCTTEEIAVSVLTSVVGRYPERSCIIVDAGAMALSKDAGDGCEGFGDIMDIDGNAIPGLNLESLSQEHGKIRVAPGTKIPPMHAPLRIRPNHSCLTAALFGEYHVHHGLDIIDRWKPIRGWTVAHGRRR